jgi:hypothetical protein
MKIIIQQGFWVDFLSVIKPDCYMLKKHMIALTSAAAIGINFVEIEAANAFSIIGTDTEVSEIQDSQINGILYNVRSYALTKVHQ